MTSKRRKTSHAAQSVRVGGKYDYVHMDELVRQYTENMGSNTTTDPPALHCCPRSYEEAYLREPVGTERQCANNEKCEGLHIPGCTGFILREFQYPEGPPNSTRQLCLMCRRKEVSRMYFHYEAVCPAVHPSVHVSSHYNLVGVPGEYHVRDCILSQGKYTGLCMPVVLHIRSAYSQIVVDGVRQYQQRYRDGGNAADSAERGPFLARRVSLMPTVSDTPLDGHHGS